MRKEFWLLMTLFQFLDSTVLFVVSTLIKEILKEVKLDKGNIKQVILLTHNIYFHKEVSYEGLHRKGDKPLFWILRRNLKTPIIQPYFEQTQFNLHTICFGEIERMGKKFRNYGTKYNEKNS